jgi:hypothetical protein
MEAQLVQTAHSEAVTGLAFPAGLGEVFATASVGGIRVWHLPSCRELLRIAVPNLTCSAVIFAPVGGGLAQRRHCAGGAPAHSHQRRPVGRAAMHVLPTADQLPCPAASC